MNKHKGFTLTEVLIAVTLTGLVILAITSVDITSRQFFGDIKEQIQVQDETNIAMEHMVKNVQLGIGDITNSSTAEGSPPSADDSRGFLILNSDGNLVASGSAGSQLRVKIDANHDGQFNSADDKIIKYTYLGESDYKIVYDPDIDTGYDEEDLVKDIISSVSFTTGSSYKCNEVNVAIEALRDPSEAEGPENPKSTLTSNIVLRAMSCK